MHDRTRTRPVQPIGVVILLSCLLVVAVLTTVPSGLAQEGQNNTSINISIEESNRSVIKFSSPTNTQSQTAGGDGGNIYFNNKNNTATPTSKPSSEHPHTIEIIRKNGTVDYTASFPGAYTLEQTEKGDAAAGDNVIGHVGSYPWENTTDQRDVIHYEGELRDFEFTDDEGAITVKIDGKTVDPNTLVSTPRGPPETVTGTVTATPIDKPISTEPAQDTATEEPANTGQAPTDQATETTSPTGGNSDSGWSLFDILLAIGVAFVMLSVFFHYT